MRLSRTLSTYILKEAVQYTLLGLAATTVVFVSRSLLRFLDDLSYADIAELLGKSLGAVRILQFRALRNMRKLIQDDLNHTYNRRAG